MVRIGPKFLRGPLSGVSREGTRAGKRWSERVRVRGEGGGLGEINLAGVAETWCAVWITRVVHLGRSTFISENEF